MRNDDIQPEKILKFSGEVRFLFQSEEEIESFYKHQFPLFEKERDGYDFIFRPGQTEEKHPRWKSCSEKHSKLE